MRYFTKRKEVSSLKENNKYLQNKYDNLKEENLILAKETLKVYWENRKLRKELSSRGNQRNTESINKSRPGTKAVHGKASWYGEEFRGRKTASGEIFDPDKLTCATNQFPFGTMLKVSYRDKEVIVRVNDRGGFEKHGRIIDLSKKAFSELAPLSKGIIWTDITRLD